MSQYLTEAFKKLDTLNEETFSVTDSGLQDFIEFTENDEDENIIDIIDVDAETVEDLEDSYIGKVILDCCVCHSKLYKDTEDVVIEDDLANTGEECPFCYANDGYKVVGQVAAFGEEEENIKEDPEEPKETDKEEPEELEEGIFGKKKSEKTIKASQLKKGDLIVATEDGRQSKPLKVKAIGNNGGSVAIDFPGGNMSISPDEDVTILTEGLFDKKPKGTKTIKASQLQRGHKIVATQDGKQDKPLRVKDIGENGGSVTIDFNGGNMSIHPDEDVEILDEGIFGIKTKKEKEKEAKAKAEKEAQKQRDKELADQEERARQQHVADSWARYDKSKRDAQAAYNRSRYNSIKGDKPSNTGYRGVNYSGGDYYTESYKDTHMIMGGDGSEVYTDEDLKKIWDNSHTSDPSMKGYKSFEDWKSDTVSQMEELDESKSIKESASKESDTFYIGWAKTDIDKFHDYMTSNPDLKIYKRGSDYYVATSEDDTYAQQVDNSIIGSLKSDSRFKDLFVESKSIKEDINNLSLDTDDTHLEMNSDENGKVTITTEPVETAKVDEGETIEPVEPEIQNEIESNVADGEEIEIDVDEFDNDSFDVLGEGYLKKVYENVDSFKTSKVSYKDNKLVLEGVIKFNSGKAKKTTFLFENKLITKKGKVRFIGENKEIARGKKSFTITGRIDNKKFLSESFNYNYGVKTSLGKVKRLYGTINN